MYKTGHTILNNTDNLSTTLNNTDNLSTILNNTDNLSTILNNNDNLLIINGAIYNNLFLIQHFSTTFYHPSCLLSGKKSEAQDNFHELQNHVMNLAKLQHSSYQVTITLRF